LEGAVANLDREQKGIVRAILQESLKIKDPVTRKKFKRAAIQTGLVESNLRNLSGGDADSAGWRQERASLYANPTNLRASVRRFREEFLQHYDPGERASDVAGQVQRPAAQYLGRYQERAGEAKQILKQFGGGGQPAPNGYQTDSQQVSLPGVDNSGARKAALQDYVLNGQRDPNSLLNLGSSLRGAADQPSSSIKVPGFNRGTPGQGGGGKRGGEATIGKLMNVAEKKFGLTVREHPSRDPVDPVHADGSWHYKNKAADISGDPAQMVAFKKWVRKHYKRDIEELILNLPGSGKNLKNGQKVGPGFYSDHEDHVHVADDD
jgi:hypothetical protein